MLRSLGSSLVAKSSPGGKLRELKEQSVTTPQIPGKGAIGSISRSGIEEPLKRETPAGSEKVVGMQPIIESQAGLPADLIPEDIAPAPIPEATSRQVRSSVPSGNNNQALFQGGVSPTGEPTKPATQQVSQGVSKVSDLYNKPVQPNTPGASSNTEILRSQNVGTGIPFTSTLGGKAFAGEGNEVLRSLPQQVVGSLGKVVSNVAPSVGNMMQSWGGQTIQSPRSQNKPAPKPNFVEGVMNQLRSVVSNLFSGLRSKK